MTPEVDKFLAEITGVCKAHGMSISHEDGHGAFLIQNYDEANIKWLKEASIEWFKTATKVPIDYSSIPHHCRDGMRLYIEQRHPVGGFLTAILSNQVEYAKTKADDVNRHHIDAYFELLKTQAPAECWGSPEAVTKWLAGYGHEG